MPVTTPSVPCVRAAWLVLGSNTVQLHNESAGYFVTDLDLGDPLGDSRAVTSRRPAQDGIVDRTAFMGGRTVAVDIVAVTGAGASIDSIADDFAPYMLPSVRPVLHYVLDRPGNPERTLVLRPSGYVAKIDNAFRRDIQLQFVAADPIARAVTAQSVTATIGTTSATFSSPGQVPFRPLVRISAVSGPLGTSSGVAGTNNFQIRCNGAGVQIGALYFNNTYVLAAGHHIDIDTTLRTALLDGDPTQSVLFQMDWTKTQWPVFPILPSTCNFTCAGVDPTNSATFALTWNDGYLL